MAAPSLAQPALHPILSHGPASNRLNVVLLAEGYTSTQLADFLVHATNAVSALLSHAPYQEYQNYLNAYAISVASNESGSDHPHRNEYHDTYFNSAFVNLEDNYITIPPDSTGQGKVDALLETLMPECGLPILLVNDGNQGASDGDSRIVIVSQAAVAHEVYSGEPYFLTHETAHVLASLGDEYDTPYPGFPDIEEPNTTQETNRLLIKWNAWIAPATPVPTPASYGDGVVGLFEGAHYHAKGWYRPQLTCTMGFSGVHFCAVCSEALILAIHEKARPIGAFPPPDIALFVSSTQALSFSVTRFQPTTHDLTIQWFINDTASVGATNATFSLPPQSLPNGGNSVRAVVHDPTPLVRNDPADLLSQTVIWTVNVNLPALRLDSPSWVNEGRDFAFRISGGTSQEVVIESSTNLLSWLPLATNFLAGGELWHTNVDAAQFQREFYRAVTLP